jgi:hypothetical protein
MVSERVVCFVFTLGCVLGCGDIETTPVEAITSEVGESGRLAAGAAFGEETYGIGSHWYDYAAMSHVLTPRPYVYLIRRGTELSSLEIVSYYDEFGESGVFSVRTRWLTDTGWAPVVETTFEKNVKKSTVCADLAPFKLVDCDDDKARLVFTTALRAVPEAGFAVANPSIFTKGSFSEGAEPTEVALVQADRIEEVMEWPENPTLLTSAAYSPSLSRVGWILHPALTSPVDDVQIQYTSGMNLVVWTVESTSVKSDVLEVRLSAYCADGAGPDGFSLPAEPIFIDVQVASDDLGAFVSLCSAKSEVVQAYKTDQTGVWSDTASFDLIIERIGDDSAAIRLPPGHLHRNWTSGLGDGSTSVATVDLALIGRELWK